MRTREEIEAGLPHFSGTFNYHLHSMRVLKYTDGVAWLAEAAECYWLLDAIASWQFSARKHVGAFQVWRLTVTRPGNSALLECIGEEDCLVEIKQEIEFTNFPLDKIELWVEEDVLLLPSEH